MHQLITGQVEEKANHAEEPAYKFANDFSNDELSILCFSSDYPISKSVLQMNGRD